MRNQWWTIFDTLPNTISVATQYMHYLQIRYMICNEMCERFFENIICPSRVLESYFHNNSNLSLISQCILHKLLQMLFNTSIKTISHAYMLSKYVDPKIVFINEIFLVSQKELLFSLHVIKVLLSAACIVIRVYTTVVNFIVPDRLKPYYPTTQPTLITKMHPRRSKYVEISHIAIISKLECAFFCRSFWKKWTKWIFSHHSFSLENYLLSCATVLAWLWICLSTFDLALNLL